MGEERRDSSSNRRYIEEEAKQTGSKELERKDELTARSVRESVIQGMS